MMHTENYSPNTSCKTGNLYNRVSTKFFINGKYSLSVTPWLILKSSLFRDKLQNSCPKCHERTILEGVRGKL